MSLYVAHRENLRNGVPVGEAHAVHILEMRSVCGISVEFLYTDHRSDWITAEPQCDACVGVVVPPATPTRG